MPHGTLGTSRTVEAAMARSSQQKGKSTDYEFVTVWRVAGTREEVVDVLGDAGTLKQWWPSVYLNVTKITPGGPDGVGASFDLHTKGWLPYTLRWRLTVTEPVTLDGFALTAVGDLNGTGRWTFATDGPETVITYDWRVSTAKPLLRRLSWLLKPAFSANHHWAMARGEESLKLELRRRRSTTDRASVPPPPGPTFTSRRKATPEQNR
ncbi:hypothetical protein ANMWB30_07270 [Arthrobacter sp. MWB30]|nr:hypothetical protein ANMWB30_07270 [Arthrobacter sp. MWB30]